MLDQKIRKRNEQLLKFLDGLLYGGTELDAGELLKNWYGDVQADVFISHSHADRDEAVMFAEWVRDKLRLEPFVDEWVWGSADVMAERLCSKSSIRYITDERVRVSEYNKLLAHVNGMLIKSLASMIARCPCFVFLNTSSSIDDQGKTFSPWIYAELEFSKLLLKNLGTPTVDQANFSEGLKIGYHPEQGHLTKLTTGQLDSWADFAKTCYLDKGKIMSWPQSSRGNYTCLIEALRRGL